MDGSGSFNAAPSMYGLFTGLCTATSEPRVAVIGHRGYGKNVVTPDGVLCTNGPSVMENTIISFNLAANSGANFVEFDVQVTKDGHPVIFHDDLIVAHDKILDCLFHKRIGDITLEEFTSVGFQNDTQEATNSLYRMSEGGIYSAWKVSVNDPLCTLEETFARVSPLVGFNIELKFDDFNPTSYQELKRSIDAVLKVVNKNNRGRKIFFSSFNPDAIILVRQEQSIYPALFLTKGAANKYPDARRNSLLAALEVCLEENLQGIVCEVNMIRDHPELVGRIKAAGLALLTFGDLNNVAEVFQLQVDIGVDGLIVDHVPEMVVESWKKKGALEVAAD